MKSVHDAAGKFSQATDSLATLPHSLQERLTYAYTGGLSRIEAGSLPDEMAADLDRLIDRLTSNPHNAQPPPGGGSVHATILAMSDDEAREVAAQLMALAHEVWQESCRRQYQRR